MKCATITAIALLFLGCGERADEQGVTTVSGETPATQSVAASATTPQLGDVAPDFSLADQTGARLRLSDVRGEKVVLVFYRGYW